MTTKSKISVFLAKAKKVCSPFCLRLKANRHDCNKPIIFRSCYASNFVFWMSAILILLIISIFIFIYTIHGDDVTYIVLNKTLNAVLLPINVIKLVTFLGCMIGVQSENPTLLYISSYIICLATATIQVTLLCSLFQVGELDASEVISTYVANGSSETAIKTTYFTSIIIAMCFEASTHYSLIWAIQTLAQHMTCYPHDGVWFPRYDGGCHQKAMKVDVC